MVTLRGSVYSWKFTGFYGNPDYALRGASWSLLSHLSQLTPDDWLCLGDFNEISDQTERVGGRIRNEAQMRAFQATLSDCLLNDLGYRGSKFTWSNKRYSRELIKERLDRALATAGWCANVPETTVEVMAARSSDHRPLWVSFTSPPIQIPRIFRFEASWNVSEDCADVIKKAWSEVRDTGPSMQAVLQKLRQCQQDLSCWSSSKFGSFTRTLKGLTRRLRGLQDKEHPSNLEEIKLLQQEIHQLMEMEDLRWRQRVKRNWYKHGDRNTQYFHAWATQRRRMNFIHSIIDQNGLYWSTPEDIGRAFNQHFQSLFTTANPNDIEEVLSGVQSLVTSEMNVGLTRCFTSKEINDALAQMHPLKAPGPDGFGVCFYQQHWDIVGEEVRKAALEFLNKGTFDPSFNSTFIVLIPKVQDFVSVGDFRPISLCNVIYKLVAKVLANCLKKVLPIIISPNQSAFVPGKLITDNIIVAYEALHIMNTRMRGKKGYMAVKLDTSKAYNRVEWAFLEKMMRKMGFAEQWIKMIMNCVSTVSYSVLINGQPMGQFFPTRGLRQGDPLSPYLFLLCVEGLSALMQTAEREGRISGVPIAVGGTRLSHLFFADDSPLFCRANPMEWSTIPDLLNLYERASGQQLNAAKTSVFFSRNTRNDFRDWVSSTAGLSTVQGFEKYLGLPAMVGRSKPKTFASLVGRVRKKLEGWKEKFLSQAGKEVLLNAVVQAIPTYAMSVFKLPKTLCKQLNSLMCKFWWNHNRESKGVNWISWKRLGVAKQQGGMGFRDIEAFNLALLAKQGWRILQYPDSLVATILREKYFASDSFCTASVGNRPPYVWRSFCFARENLEGGLWWRVGNGESIKVWKDKWLPCSSTSQILSPVNGLDEEARVSSLIDPRSGGWNMPLLRAIFSPWEVELIGSIPLSPLCKPDKLIWQATSHGCFSVKSAYHAEILRRTASDGESSRRAT